MSAAIEHAERLIQVAQLGDIQLWEGTCGRKIRSPDEIEDGAQLAFTLTYDAVFAQRLEDVFYVHATLLLEVVVRRSLDQDVEDAEIDVEVEGDELSVSEDAVAWVKSVFELAYRVPNDFEGSEAEFQGFAETNGVFNAWPFFREFVHNSLSRMGLPPISLPLFRVARQDESDHGER